MSSGLHKSVDSPVGSPLKGFGVVTAACFTSGLAGVYFEMVPSRTEADGRSSIAVETWREQNLLIRAQYDTSIDVLPVMAITAVVEPRCLPA